VKNFTKLIGVIVLLTTCIVASCTKGSVEVLDQDVNSKSARIPSRTQTDVFNQIQPYLDVLGKKMMWVANDTKARTILYKEIEYKFDGDYNVLLEKLIDKYKLANFDNDKNLQLTKFDSAINSDFNEVLTKFKKNTFKLEARGTELYPQLFIPFYEELKKSGKIGKEVPVLVIYSGDEHTEKRVGYTVDNNNRITKTDFEIDESYAKQHEVWVVSLSERVFHSADITKYEERKKAEIKKAGARAFYASTGNAYSDCQDLPYGQSPVYGESQGIKLTIPSLSIKTYKESWIAGASEVYVVIASTWGNGHTQYPPFNSITNTSPIDRSFVYDENYLTFKENELVEVSRSDVGQYYQVGTQYPDFTRATIFPYEWGVKRTLSNGATYTDIRRDCLVYAIYEYDSGYNTSSDVINISSWDTSDPSTNPAYLSFRSSDSEFFRGYIYKYMVPGQPGQPCAISVISPDISFVIQAQKVVY